VTRLTYYVFLDELLDLLCCGGRVWFDFNPCCEIINSYDEELDLNKIAMFLRMATEMYGI